jgi:hypothetical protein
LDVIHLEYGRGLHAKVPDWDRRRICWVAAFR